MIELLPTVLMLAALSGLALVAYRSIMRKLPAPAIDLESSELPQGVSLLIIVCVTASAAVSPALFAFFGAEHSLEAHQPFDTGSPFMLVLAAYVVTCIATGFYEEILFRVILQGVLERGFRGNGVCRRRCILYATILGSLLFAVLHAVGPIEPDADQVQVVLQAVFKCMQAFLFGVVMVGLVKRTGSLALVVGIHSCYNLLFFLPWLITTRAFPETYLTGIPLDTVGLIITSVCLVPVAILALRFLSYGGEVQRRAE